MRKNGGRMSKGSQGGPISSKKGPWTDAEDAILTDYVRNHGEGNWNVIQSHTGLARCGKSCRLRWVNHLRPDLRKGAFTQEEERRIVELQALLGNKWARIAQEFPGRTDNEIKNFWNTRCKRLERAGKPIYPEDLCQQILNASQSAQDMIGSSADGDAFSNDPSNSDSFEVPKFDKFDLSREISSYMPMPMPPSGPPDTVSPHNTYNRISPSLRTHNWIQVPQASYLDNDGLPCADYGFGIVGDNQFGAIDPGYISDLSIPDQQGNYNTLPGCHDGYPARDVGLPESLVGLVEDDTFLTEMYASLNGDNPYCYSPSSRPVLTGSKLELPSFQNRDSQQDGSVRESTPLNPLLSHKSTGTLIQNPIYDQAQSDRPLPRNSGLLDAMFSGPTTLNDCLNATDPLSALRLESHDLIPPLVAPIGGSSSEPTPTADIFDSLPDLGDWSSPDEMNTTARFD